MQIEQSRLIFAGVESLQSNFRNLQSRKVLSSFGDLNSSISKPFSSLSICFLKSKRKVINKKSEFALFSSLSETPSS
jgi:hypothetical protein